MNKHEIIHFVGRTHSSLVCFHFSCIFFSVWVYIKIKFCRLCTDSICEFVFISTVQMRILKFILRTHINATLNQQSSAIIKEYQSQRCFVEASFNVLNVQVHASTVSKRINEQICKFWRNIQLLWIESGKHSFSITEYLSCMHFMKTSLTFTSTNSKYMLKLHKYFSCANILANLHLPTFRLALLQIYQWNMVIFMLLKDSFRKYSLHLCSHKVSLKFIWFVLEERRRQFSV